MIVQFRLRRGLASEWALDNPILAEGEPGYERDTGRLKIGNGVDPWEELRYAERDVTALVFSLIEGYETLTMGISTGINFGEGSVHDITLTSNVTLTNVDEPRMGGRLVLLLRQDDVGSRILGWPTNFRFAGNAPPTLSTAPNTVDVLEFVYDGTRWREVGRSLGTPP